MKNGTTGRRFPNVGGTLIFAALGGTAMFLGTTAQSASPPTLRTDEGDVTGMRLPGTPAIEAFLGIPYAAPPVGDLRFRAPRPHASWTGLLQATQVAQPCTQFSPRTGAIVGGEDCLYLNVYAPLHTTWTLRPVMVYLPGGAFTQGSASSPYYNAKAIAEQAGVVVVTVTYRVGALGFLAAPALDHESPHAISGNYGLQDQQAALRWVRRNIAAFGGDSARITLFGESAGANSTEYQLTSPSAAGLFENAIIESAVGMPLIPDLTLARSETGGSANVIAKVGCAGKDDVAACLRALPATAFLMPAADMSLSVRPVVDDVLFPRTPLQAFRTGRFNRVPTIIGSNHDEFTSLIPASLRNPPLTSGRYAAVLAGLFGPNAAAIQAEYPPGTYRSPLQAYASVGTDAFVACPTEQKRRALSRYVPVYGYEFNEPHPAEGPILEPQVPDLSYGNYHTAELPYVFGVTAPNGVPVTGKDAALSRSVISYWTSFATYGHPGVHPQAGVPIWPNYVPDQLLSLKDQVAPLAAKQFAIEHHCKFWEALGLQR